MTDNIIVYGLELEDYHISEDDSSNWAYLCKEHAHGVPSDHLESSALDDTICGALGCTHTADFYLNFDDTYIKAAMPDRQEVRHENNQS